MIVIMGPNADREHINDVIERVKSSGLQSHVIEGEAQTIVGVVGTPIPPSLQESLEILPGVTEVVRVSTKFKLSGRDFHPHDTRITINPMNAPAGTPPVVIGGDAIAIIAGPCSVESEEQIMESARGVRAAGAVALRGGAYKPRTSPYEFRGLGERGLQFLAEARAETGLAIITEVMTPSDVELVAQYTDIFQIGARNSQNYLLLEEVGKAGKPVMLKRGLSMLIEEWILAAEYVMAQGNPDVMLCERGIRTYETSTRNTLDVSAVPVVKKLSHLPILIDPSHAAGKRAFVGSLSLAAIAAGADGLMIEAHPDPDHALSDGAQSISIDEFQALMPRIAAVAAAIGRPMPALATVAD
ncbi:MAG: 3-deoxy-7-phosphoheptulonate synthase [Thermomicrobiales bacterium]